MPPTCARSPAPRALAALAAAALLALLAGVAAAPSAPAKPTAAVKRCADVAFTPNSDDLAASIRATRVGCAVARRFIRSSHGHPGRRHRGFACSREREDGATLPRTRYRCTKGARTIRWDRF